MRVSPPSDHTSTRSATPDLGELYIAQAARVRRAVTGEVRAPGPVIEEACQTAWARLVDAADRVNRDTTVAWLVTTAIHEAVRLLRRDRRDTSLERLLQELPGGDWEPHGPDIEELVALRLRLGALRTLPTRQGRLIWLQGLGLSYAEMADETGDTERTVQRQVLRGRHRLRELDAAQG